MKRPIMAKQHEIAKTEAAPLVLAQGAPRDFGTLEGATKQDLAFPRLHLYQGTQLELKKYGRFDAGDFIDTRDNTKLPHPEFLPIRAWYEYIEWAPRQGGAGGGIVKRSLDKNAWPEHMLKFGADGTPPAVSEFIHWLLLFKGQELPFVVSFKGRALETARMIHTLSPMKMGSNSPSWFRLLAKDSTYAKGVAKIFALTSAARLTADDGGTWELAMAWIETMKRINLATLADANKAHDAGDDDSPTGAVPAAPQGGGFGGDVGF